MQTLIKLLEFLQPYGSYAYAFMFIILIACGFGFPMPEDVVLISGGILASRPDSQVHYAWVVGVCMLGVLGGDGVVFTLGNRFGPWVRRHPFFRKLLTEKRDAQAQAIFHKYGPKVVFMGRFMPGLRTPIVFTVGSYHIPLWKFFLLDGLAALISVPLWIYVGYVFGQNLEELDRRVHQFQFGIYGVLVFIILAFVVAAVIKKRALKNVAAEAE